MMAPQDQRRLHRLLKSLFQKWQVTDNQRAQLLGLSQLNWAAGVFDPVALERATMLLGIHSKLRVLFPQNRELRYLWITRRNDAFGQQTPLNIMCEQELPGMVSIARYLENAQFN